MGVLCVSITNGMSLSNDLIMSIVCLVIDILILCRSVISIDISIGIKVAFAFVVVLMGRYLSIVLILHRRIYIVHLDLSS